MPIRWKQDLSLYPPHIGTNGMEMERREKVRGERKWCRMKGKRKTSNFPPTGNFGLSHTRRWMKSNKSSSLLSRSGITLHCYRMGLPQSASMSDEWLCLGSHRHRFFVCILIKLLSPSCLLVALLRGDPPTLICPFTLGFTTGSIPS